MSNNLLIVEDDEDLSLTLAYVLREQFEKIKIAAAPDQALAALAERRPDVVLLDLNFTRGETSGEEGLSLMQTLLQVDPTLAVVVITAFADVDLAVQALKAGAADLIEKPWDNARLKATLMDAGRISAGRRTARLEGPAAFEPLIGRSPAAGRLKELVQRVGPSDASVLVLGEPGVGKTFVARALHAASGRADGPFVLLDVSSWSSIDLDREAEGRRAPGEPSLADSFNLATEGALLLDDIGSIDPRVQDRLISLMDGKRLATVSPRERRSPRLIASSCRTLPDLVGDRTLRPDLLMRLNTVVINVPPLRERPEDIQPLAEHFLRHYEQRYERPARVFPDAEAERLVDHPWSGNVRALRHACERAVILSASPAYSAEDFGLGLAVAETDALDEAEASQSLSLLEKSAVQAALNANHYNISRAAEQLGVSRAALYRRIRKFGL